MTAEKNKSNRILESDLFEAIPKEKLIELAGTVENQVVPKHTVLFEQGDPGDRFYIINSGRVKVFRKDEDGLETDFSEMGPGESFGEMALLTGRPRSASVETIEETYLTVVPKDRFEQVLKDYPQISMKFINQMSGWLLRDEERLMEEKQRQTEKQGLLLVDYIIIVSLSLLFAIIYNKSNPNGINLIPDLFPDEVIQQIKPSAEMAKTETEEYLLIDARPANFFNERHIEGALNMPYALFDIMYLMFTPKINNAKHVIVYGRTISRRYDEQVARKLILRGHENIKIMRGGMRAWNGNGLPIEP